MRKLLLAATIALAGCVSAQKPPNNPNPFANLQVVDYSNGLTNAERNQYYYADEGIQYLPLDVLMALDRPVEDGFGLYDERFLARPERLGLYPNLLSNSSIPIGITVSRDSNYVPMAGINCATCHTSVITHEGKALLVDGNSGLFAIDRLIKEMVFSVAATLTSPVEFDKFYTRFQERTNLKSSEPDKKSLKRMMQSAEYNQLNTAVQDHLKGKNKTPHKDVKKFLASVDNTTLTSGAYPTRDQLDSEFKMFVYLTKRLYFFYEQSAYAGSPDGSTVAESGLGRSNPWSVVKNMLASHLENKDKADFPKVPGGPINTPVIWGFDQSKWIFWMGVTNSMLERNMAQGVALVTDFNWDTYESTVSVKKLHQVSSYTKKITPPIWPENILGAIDQNKSEQGKVLFKDKCLGCHVEPKQWGQGTASFSFQYMDVGTDPEYYKGQVESFYSKDLFKDALAPWLKKVKEAAYKREGVTNPSLYESGRMNVVWKAPTGNMPEARPLYGIWASAPFLHNGSVPSIRELLKKPQDRITEFFVGSTEYDTVNLGFKSVQLYYSFNLQTGCAQCTGNSNQGHDFGTDLSDAEKDQLIEFLKGYTTETKFK